MIIKSQCKRVGGSYIFLDLGWWAYNGRDYIDGLVLPSATQELSRTNLSLSFNRAANLKQGIDLYFPFEAYDQEKRKNH